MERVFGASAERLGLRLVYDVAHNIAKFEEHEVGGKKRQLCVHRKGATRAFAAGHPELAGRHAGVGQPVIVPGDMGSASYVMADAAGDGGDVGIGVSRSGTGEEQDVGQEGFQRGDGVRRVGGARGDSARRVEEISAGRSARSVQECGPCSRHMRERGAGDDCREAAPDCGHKRIIRTKSGCA